MGCRRDVRERETTNRILTHESYFIVSILNIKCHSNANYEPYSLNTCLFSCLKCTLKLASNFASYLGINRGLKLGLNSFLKFPSKLKTFFIFKLNSEVKIIFNSQHEYMLFRNLLRKTLWIPGHMPAHSGGSQLRGLFFSWTVVQPLLSMVTIEHRCFGSP